MNDQSKMMNKKNLVQSQMMNQNPVQMLSGVSVAVQSQAMNQMNQQVMNPVQSQMMNQMNPVQQPVMMNRSSYKPWQQQQHQQLLPPSNNFSKNRSNWKGKKVNSEKRKDSRRMEKQANPNNNIIMNSSSLLSNNPSGGTGGYNPPTLHELQSQNRLKARKFYPKKKFNNRFAPYAPRNTTSFIIRAKKAGGIASLVSPCPVTPAVLPTPIFSPSREVLGDMAKEEWGVDGYGSMKGLIRLRSPGHEADDEEEDGNGSSESDVEEHVEVERRLDHDLSRFEMIYPSYGGGGGVEYNNVLENRVDDQDSHIAQLEEENLTLKERLFLMERELGDLRRRLQFLERQSQVVVVDVNEEVVENENENESENESDGGSDVRGCGGGGTGSDNNNNQEVMVEYVSGRGHGRGRGRGRGGNERNVVDVDDVKEVNNERNEGVGDVCMEEFVPDEVVVKEDESKDGEAMNVGNEILSDKLVAKHDESKGEKAGKEILGNQIVEE